MVDKANYDLTSRLLLDQAVDRLRERYPNGPMQAGLNGASWPRTIRAEAVALLSLLAAIHYNCAKTLEADNDKEKANACAEDGHRFKLLARLAQEVYIP